MSIFPGNLQTGEAKVPQPFNNLEDHSHELGGPPLPAKTTQKPWQNKPRKNKAKDNEVSVKIAASNFFPGSSA